MAVGEFVVEFTDTAVLVFKLRSPQCLLTPIFTLMTSFFSFFSQINEVRYIFIQEIVQA